MHLNSSFFKKVLSNHKALSSMISSFEKLNNTFTSFQKNLKNIKSSRIFETKISLSPRHFSSLKFTLCQLNIKIDLLILFVVSTMQFFLIFEYFLKIIILRFGRKSIPLSTEQISRYVHYPWTLSSVRLHMLDISSGYRRAKDLPLKLTHLSIPITSL